MLNSPIRILHFIGSLDIGGSQAMVMNIYRKIDRQKIQFDFIIDHENGTFFKNEIESLGGRVYFFPNMNGKNIFKVLKFWNNFFIKHNEYKVIHFHVRSYTSLLIPIVKKNGLFTIVHSHSTSNGNGLFSLIKYFLQLPLRFQGDYFLACSDEAGRWLFGDNVLRKKNYKTIPNAIDGKKFYFDIDKRNEVRKKLDINDECFVLGNIGRMTYSKNQMFLVELLYEIKKTHSNVKLLLVGDGETYNSIREKVIDMKLENEVIMIGSSSTPELFYHAMDVFVFPSFWEGLGIVTIEAQANGLKCIVSDKIPKSIDIGSNLISYLSLNSSKITWIEKIFSNPPKRINQEQKLKQSGFEIENNIIWIEKFYIKNHEKFLNGEHFEY